MANYWQDEWELPRHSSLAQFSRILDHVIAEQHEDHPDPDLAALAELEPFGDEL